MKRVRVDQVTKHCVSSLNALNIKGKKMVGAKVPEIEKEALKIKELYERYVFAQKRVKVTRFVLDFLPGCDGRLYFMQVKHFECRNKFHYDPKLIQRIKMTKGLAETDAECVGIFCKSISSQPVLSELIARLTATGSLDKKWNRAGVYLVPSKLILDYNAELDRFR